MKYEFQQCIGSRIRQLSRIVDGYFRSHLAAFGITENQMTILFALHKMGKVEQGVIGQHLSLERSTVSRNIKLLEKRGLVVKSSQYRPDITLTEQGVIMVNQLVPIWESIMDNLFDKLGETGIDSLKKIEERIK